MLEFWFDPKVSITRKLMIFLCIAIVTAILYLRHPLTLDVILMFLAVGIIFLICRYCKVHFLAQRPRHILTRLSTWLPIALLLALIFAHAQTSLLQLGAQGIGFMALAVCLFSPLSLLNNNQHSDRIQNDKESRR